jgi:formylglycine-generating enzyme required for sulfatase activity
MDYAKDQGGKPIEDIEDILDVNDDKGRVLRGGSFNHTALFVRSAHRNLNAPAVRNNIVGFRPARTFR